MVVAAAPSTIDPWIKRRRQVGDCGRLIAPNPGEKLGEKGKKKSSSSPALRVQGKKKSYSAVKTALFWASVFFFFFATVNETAPFWSKRAISFKRKRRQKHHIQISTLHLRAFYNLVLGLGFLQLSP